MLLSVTSKNFHNPIFKSKVIYEDSNIPLTSSKKVEDKKRNYTPLAITAVGLCAFCCVLIHNRKTSSKSKAKNVIEGTSTAMTEADKAFLKNISKSLNVLGINAKIEDLKSIVAPNEFKTLIKKFKPEHFKLGMQVSETKAQNVSLEEFYKNVINGDFRVSLHTHSNFSDGKATVEEFLESARKYADKVAKLNKNDGLPPFTIALTDHDCVSGCQEIIKIIAKNPEKYKNLKFVSGCEFSVKNGNVHHDITGLALNPFDKNLVKELDDLAYNRAKTVRKFLEEQPEFNGKKITYEDLAKFEKEYYESKNKLGKRCIENISGIVAVRHAVKFYYEMTNQKLNKNIMNQLGDKDILPIEKVISAIKNNGGYASLTHPTKSFWRYVGDEYLTKLKNIGVTGIEVNHQYTPSKISELGKINRTENADALFEDITKKYKNFAESNGLFLSGGTDSHEKQVFSREPKITNAVLDKIYN